MKRIFSIIFAGVLGLLASSCVNEELTMFDTSKATAPVLNSFQVGENEIVANYTPGVFKQGFNDKIAPNHSFAIVSAGGQTFSRTVTTTDKDGVLTLKPVNLAKALMTLGFAEGSTTDVELAVRATMQDPSKDNGINGFVDSQGRINITGFEVVIPEVVGSPYADYTDASEWSLIGALSAYGINWDGDLNMWTDGNGNHVAAHVTLKADDEFKFRKDQDWGVNMGGEFSNLDSEFSVTQDGANIKVGADGVYDLFVNPDSGIAWISAAYDPYPDFTETSTWSVIGNLTKVGIEWNGDVAMVTDGSTHIAFGVDIAADDEFKFRKDQDWAVNLGGEFTAIDDEFAVTQDGANIKVGTEGVYDLFVMPDAGTAKVSEASGMKISSIIGGDEPGPEPEPVTGWNIIGLNGDWDNDIRATESEGVWTAYITAESDTEFKWRKDGGWDENYGGEFVELGEPFDAVAGGDNIKVPAGFYKVELNTNDLTITVSNGSVWSLIGVNGDWENDIDMTLTDGKWVSPVTKISGDFKLRENHGWDNNRGGVFVALGEPFEAVAGGDNINVEEGNYVVTYDPEAETIVIDETGWGLVGTINGWGGDGPDIILKESGLFLVAKNVSLSATDEIKLRYNSDWGINRGGRTAVGKAVKAEPDGGNIKPGVEGEYDVYYRPDSEVIFVVEAGSELTYWGVVGTINGWGAPDRIMYETEDGKFVYENLETTGAAEIKIRQNEDWGVNRGGDFVEFGEPFAVEDGGPNMKLAQDATFTVTYDPEAETVTLDGEYSGEAPALPETMYIIGEAVGGWDWTGDYIVDMVPVNGKPGQFWSIRYLEAGKPFKFCAVKEWSGDFTGLGEDTGYVVADNNCNVEESGVYMIYVDTDNKKLCIEPAKVYGIGDCFGGWEADPVAFSIEEDKVVGKTSAKGDIRLYADSSIATSDWWTREFVFFDGKIAYRGNGGDQERVNVEADMTVTLDFNAGTAVVE